MVFWIRVYMSQDLTMSMRVDRHEVFPGVTLRPRVPKAWIPDDRVDRCFGCNTLFSIFKRKHHCRHCGRVFCDPCTAYREKMPSYLEAIGPTPLKPGSKCRMCAQCASSLRKSSKIEWLIHALSVMPITFPELFKVRLLNRDWNHSVNTMLSLYRGLQYKLPSKKYTTVEANFLRTHYAEFGHHIPWQVHAFCAAVQHRTLNTFQLHIDSHNILSCRWCLCSRTCCNRLSIDNIIQLGMSKCLKNRFLLQAVVNAWNEIQVGVHVRMMPWWVYLGSMYEELFYIGLIPLSLRKIEMVYSLWFECELQKNPSTHILLQKVQDRLLQNFRRELMDELHVSVQFVHLLESLVQKKGKRLHDKLIHEFLSKHGQVRLPWNPKESIVSMTSTKRFSSSSAPLSFTCVTAVGATIQILVKREDVRTDRLAMVIGYWICTLTHQTIMLYDVFPFSHNSGCIMMIDDARTLYDVRKTHSLLNYMMSNNPNETVMALRQRIVRSCAGACLLAFTMGLGDRHLENILVIRDGSLAHVDFGFILGEDPKHVSTPMRITEDMVDAMGGHGSRTFVGFIQKTQKGYEIMRSYVTLWYHLLVAESLIHRRKDRPHKLICEHVLNRFVPGEWNEEASMHIQTVVQKATEGSFFQRAADMLHDASNQMTYLFQTEV